MKHLKHLVAITTALALLTSCDMDSIESKHYTSVHITTYQFSGDLEITSWREYHDGLLEVNTKEYGYIVLSGGTCILISGKCPICDRKNKLA